MGPELSLGPRARAQARSSSNLYKEATKTFYPNLATFSSIETNFGSMLGMVVIKIRKGGQKPFMALLC